MRHIASAFLPDSLLPDLEVADIVLVNDAEQFQQAGEDMVEALREKGRDISVETLSSTRAMEVYLEAIAHQEDSPKLFMLDVVGVGQEAAEKVIDWFKENRPGAPVPEIHFYSSVGSLSASAAGDFRQHYPESEIEYIFPDEVEWTTDHLKAENKSSPPTSLALRRFLNKALGTDFPLATNNSYGLHQKELSNISNRSLIDAWKSKKIDPVQAIERLRNYVTGIADALRQGLYMIDPDIGHEAKFYESSGFPATGPVAFTMDDVEELSQAGAKPVLVMQSYEPELMQIVKSGKLGGLVILSPYMASHIKFISDSNNVPGLFGMAPDDGTKEYDEDIKPGGPAWIEDGEVILAGQKIEKGQSVLVDSKNAGIIADAEKITSIEAAASQRRWENPQEQADKTRLAEVNKLFSAYFKEKGIAAPRFKANVDSTNNNFDDSIGIGLVRTEQMVLGNAGQADIMRDLILKGADKKLADELYENMLSDYCELMGRAGRTGTPLRIRLLDWPLEELLDKNQQNEFIDRYGTMDIEGGAALEAWPEIYKAQADAIMAALLTTSMDKTGEPVEIMMPSIRTAEETLQVKTLIEDALEKTGMDRSRIKFGVMIETLDSAKNIDAIAPHIEFISFGTNDLTQETLKIGRGDYAGRNAYKAEHGFDPFVDMAPEVLEIVNDVTIRSRQTQPCLQVDACGAQAADLKTAFTLSVNGVNNISVSPVPVNLYALPALLNYQIFDASRA